MSLAFYPPCLQPVLLPRRTLLDDIPHLPAPRLAVGRDFYFITIGALLDDLHGG